MEIQAALRLPDETDAFLRISDIVFERCSESGFDKLTDTEATFHCVDALMRALTNGGITQFLYETGQDRFDKTITALKIIKVNKASALLEQVKRLLGQALSEDEEKRTQFIDTLEISPEMTFIEEKLFSLETELTKGTLKYVAQQFKN